MGCLNYDKNFQHKFGNIHFSGPCNRSCYFCIGQHMMALDSLNNLDTWPLKGIDEFIEQCSEWNISEINLTGSNTDPSLYKHLWELYARLNSGITDLRFGIRTNGIHIPGAWELFDKVSFSIHSFDPVIYKKMMGQGRPPEIERIVHKSDGKDLKLNIVLGPENTKNLDFLRTIARVGTAGITIVNLREPYGQPHIGDPMLEAKFEPVSDLFGMPQYKFGPVTVTYWDVHYVEVESVNLYANGRISTTYPITKGHDPSGLVLDQSHFAKSGRQTEQWINA